MLGLLSKTTYSFEEYDTIKLLFFSSLPVIHSVAQRICDYWNNIFCFNYRDPLRQKLNPEFRLKCLNISTNKLLNKAQKFVPVRTLKIILYCIFLRSKIKKKKLKIYEIARQTKNRNIQYIVIIKTTQSYVIK